MPTELPPSVNNKMRFNQVIHCLIGGFILATVAFNVPSVIATPAAAGESLNAGIRYLLYTSRNPQTPQLIEPEVESLIRSYFYALEPIVLSIPQWQSNSSAALTTALLAQQKCNVFAVDLSEVETESEIVESVSKFVLLLHQQFDVPLGRQQLVGFAEGAHLSGAIAAAVQQLLGEKLPQITALDPTAANSIQLTHQLSAKDAEFVEVLHTNGQELGTMQQLGDVDYYPNGGQVQPGCDSAVCSQQRALDLAIEMWSAHNDFVAAQCATVEHMNANNCRWSSQRMGVNLEAISGIYFLETGSKTPFGRGAYHIGFL